MSCEISIIIVTWNAREIIDKCIESAIKSAGNNLSFEIIVVDNASNDKTVEHVQKNWAGKDNRVRLVESGRNGGMAFGNNLGMLEASADTFLLLNSDAFLEDNALEIMYSALKADEKDISAVVPALKNTDGSTQNSVRAFPTTWRYITEFFYLRRIAPNSKLLNSFYAGNLDLTHSQMIDWATGACLLVPRSAVDKVGLMDESYVMYGEEVDWLKRMRDAGRKVLWLPEATATHIGGSSTRKEWNKWYGVQLKNHVRYMAKRVSQASAKKTKIAICMALLMRSFIYISLGVLPIANAKQRRLKSVMFWCGYQQVKTQSTSKVDDALMPSWPAASN